MAFESPSNMWPQFAKVKGRAARIPSCCRCKDMEPAVSPAHSILPSVEDGADDAVGALEIIQAAYWPGTGADFHAGAVTSAAGRNGRLHASWRLTNGRTEIAVT